MIGPLLNMLPLRVRLPRFAKVTAILRQVQFAQADVTEHGHASLAAIQSWSSVGGSLLTTTIAFENYPRADAKTGTPIEVLSRRYEQRREKTLSLIAVPEDQLLLLFRYNPNTYGRDTVDLFATHFVEILDRLAHDSQLKVEDILAPSAAERERQLARWSHADEALPEPDRLDLLIARQASKQPDALAVSLGAATLTYGDLEQRAEMLADMLHEQGVGPEVRVGVCLDRSPEMAVACLAVMKAGGAFVPLDPQYPTKHLRDMLTYSDAPIVLTTTNLRGILGDFRGVVLDMNTTFAGAGLRFRQSAGLDNAAYVSFTSGSTGRPKASETTHRSATTYLGALTRTYGLSQDDVVLQLASLSFDASVRDLLGPLIAGAHVVLVPADELGDAGAIAERVRAYGVTCLLSVVPSVARAWTDWPDDLDSLQTVRLVLCSGETLHGSDCRQLRALFGGDVQIVNQYGPTETTMTATYHLVSEPELRLSALPVGRPFGGAEIYVLDDALEVVPIGTPGEVFV
ncbi:MAG: AMP-binding protein, partial [bacterium]